jgi:hypothetical protein
MQTLSYTICFSAELHERRVLIEIEKISHDQAAGRKVSVPFGTLPRSTRRL